MIFNSYFFLEVDRYRMVTVGPTERNTEFQFYGSNLSCNKSANPIPRFSFNLTEISVSQFKFESIAFSAITSTLVVCGGIQTTSTVTTKTLRIFKTFEIIKTLKHKKPH